MTGLLGSTVLELAIGVVFVYLLLAVCCTTVNEWISGLFKTRPALLRQGIAQMLGSGVNDSSAAKLIAAFYNHPLVKGLMRDGQHPSYLPARIFAKAIMDIATPNQPGSITFDQLETGIEHDLPDGSLKVALLATIQSSDRNIQSAQRAIEAWYDDSMDRVSGWYKRRTQVWTVAIAALLTIATNADTINIARRLWVEPVLRTRFVESAKAEAVGTTPAKNAVADQATQTLGQVIGWQHLDNVRDPRAWLERIIGWLLTIIAVSLGAPFWFDVLNKFMNLRSAGRSPEEVGKSSGKPDLPLVNP